MRSPTRDDSHRVVITGLGVLTTVAQEPEGFLQALVAGRSGISHWQWAAPECYSKIGGDMSDFDLETHFATVGDKYAPEIVQCARRLLRATPLAGRLTAAAALQAFSESGLRESGVDPERSGHVMAGHNLNMAYIADNVRAFADEPDFIDPLYGLMVLDTDILSVTSELLDLKGPSFTVGNACASGNLALLAGLDLIRSGRADRVLVTGGATALDSVILQGWALIDALSSRSFNDEPERASRPFDLRREGFVPSEGAAAVVLETLEGARRRGASVRGELLGAAVASDACRLTRPDLGGQVRAIRLALADAQVLPEEIDYVNAHATSTPIGDAMEVAALKAVLGEHAQRIPINSTKSMTGHCLCSAGVVELVATVLQMEHDVVHPTINQEEPDPELELDFVPNVARPHRIDLAVSNSFGFGGLNSCVVVGRAPRE